MGQFDHWSRYFKLQITTKTAFSPKNLCDKMRRLINDGHRPSRKGTQDNGEAIDHASTKFEECLGAIGFSADEFKAIAAAMKSTMSVNNVAKKGRENSVTKGNRDFLAKYFIDQRAAFAVV